ncbi:hypothetical protein BC827DRAFT_239954 [Russula dissimulans]|nr:hypothetical protein BC827DRAFT_239954 [Russula dissimulans]
MTNKRHEGYELDSALTAPILNIIQQKFVDLYKVHGREVSDEFFKALRNSDILLESFIRRLSNSVSSKISKPAQKQIVHLIAHQTHDAVSSGTVHTIDHHIAHFASTAVGSQVMLLAAKVLVHAFATNIGHILVKFMASAAFKNVVHALVHKMVMGVIVSTVVKFLAASFGGAVGVGSLSFILFPIMAGVIYAQAKAFPSKLGREVSKSVRDYLSSEFDGMNREILEDVFWKIFQGEELLEAIAADKDIREMLFAVAKEFN